jgi:hypothetical protein
MFSEDLSAFVMIRDVKAGGEFLRTSYGPDPKLMRKYHDADVALADAEKKGWKEMKKNIRTLVTTRPEVLEMMASTLCAAMIRGIRLKPNVIDMVRMWHGEKYTPVEEDLVKIVLNLLGAESELMDSERLEPRRVSVREKALRSKYDTRKPHSVSLAEDADMSEFELETIQFFCEESTSMTVVLAMPLFRRILATRLKNCKSDTDEEEVGAFFNTVVALVSRTCVRPIDLPNHAVVLAAIPSYVQQDKKGKVVCKAIRTACENLSLFPRQVQLRMKWLCAIAAGLATADWLRAEGFSTGCKEGLYDEDMCAAWDILMVVDNYRKLDEVLATRNMPSMSRVHQFTNDSQYVQTVEARLYVTGIVGSDGCGSWAIYKKLLMWIIDRDNEIGQQLFGPGNRHDMWSWRVAEATEKSVLDHYNLYQASTDLTMAAMGSVTRVLKGKSCLLQDLHFFEGAGPPLHQDCKVFNFDHLQHLVTVLATGT